MTIVKRLVKGSPLTNAELDGNFTDLDTRASANAAAVAAASAAAAAKAANLSDLADKSAARSNLGAAAGGNEIVYSGAGRALAASDNGCTIRCTSSGPVSMSRPSGLPAGFGCVLVQATGAGVVTLSAGAGATLTARDTLYTSGAETSLVLLPRGTDGNIVYSEGSTGLGGATSMGQLSDVQSYDLATINQSVAAVKATAEAALAGSVSLVTVVPTNAAVGQTLFANIAPGWSGSLQWMRNGVDIGGATAASYVAQAADAGTTVNVRFTPTNFDSNGSVVSAAGAGGTLTSAAGTLPNGQDVTAAGYRDWFHTLSGLGFSGGAMAQKAGVSLISQPPTLTNIGSWAVNSQFSSSIAWTGTDAVNGDGNPVAAQACDLACRMVPADTAQLARVTWTVPANTGTQVLKLWGGTYRESGSGLTGAFHIGASLSDNSAPAISIALQGAEGGINGWARDITFKAATAGQTLTFWVETDANAIGQIFVNGGALV